MPLQEIFFNADYGVGRGIATRIESEGEIPPPDGLKEKDTFSAVVDDDAMFESILPSQTAVHDIGGSQSAMDAVAASPTATDTMVASQTARDAIGSSGPGYDAVAAVPMAIGKYAAGAAGLTPSNFADIEAVASDATAMDAVAATQTARDAIAGSAPGYDTIAASSTAIGKYAAGAAGLTPSNFADTAAVASDATAMDAVAGSIHARTAILSGPTTIDDIWKQNTPADEIVNEFSPGPGASLSGATLDTGPTQYANGYSLEFNYDDSRSDNFTEMTLDFTHASNLELTTFANEVDFQNHDQFNISISIDGTEILNQDGSKSWTLHSLDVSGYSGELTLKVGVKPDATRAGEIRFSEIVLG